MEAPSQPPKLTAVPGGAQSRDRLVDAWLPSVVRWCSHLGGPGVDHEDAAHDVMIIALRKMDRLYDQEHAAAWLFGITRRVLAQHRRRAWVRRWVPGLDIDAPDRSRGPAALVAANQSAAQVQAILDQLPVAERQVLVLCLMEERSDREVADMLDVPHGTVKSRMRRARARFLELAGPMGLTVEAE